MNNNTTGSSFNEFLIDEGICEEVEAGAIKKIIAYQLKEAIKKEQLAKTVFGLWKDRNITKETLREKAWKKN